MERGIVKTSHEDLDKLARILGKEITWFFLDEVKSSPRPPEAALSDIEVSIKAYVPVYGEVSAGPGMEPIDYVATTRSKAAPDTLRAFRVKGLCLNPEVKDGDTLIVDTALTPRNGDLVVCLIDGEASVKKYVEKQGKDGKPEKYLKNNHGTYMPENVQQIGVVVEYTRKRR